MDFCAALDAPTQNIIFLIVHFFTLLVLIARQPGQWTYQIMSTMLPTLYFFKACVKWLSLLSSHAWEAFPLMCVCLEPNVQGSHDMWRGLTAGMSY